MKKILILLVALLNATLSIGQNAKSISNENLVGSWSLVSIDNIYPDNSRVHPTVKTQKDY